MFLRIDSIYLPVTDLDKARDFYAMRIGLPELFDEDDFVGFAVGETTIVLEEVEAVIQGADISVVVESLEAATDELEQRGIETIHLTDGVSPVDLVQFDDPWGNSWTMVQE